MSAPATASTTETPEPVLSVRGLTKDFRVGGLFSRNSVRALNAVDLDLPRGRILALVGESGSGKSTLARCLVRLERPSSGSILTNGRDLLRTERRGASRAYRGEVQMVFQDPFGSLNPAHRVDYLLTRALRVHRRARGAEQVQARLRELMAAVDLSEELLDAYPHELSGGQRQRVAIARALAVEPRVILADEPTSMLDVSVRVGVLNLMRRLRAERGISMLYITHDLASARYVADTIVVMYAGELVEGGDALTVLAEPAHPYTRLLLSAAPDPNRVGEFDPVERARLRAEVLTPTSCPYEGDPEQQCSSTEPVRHQVGGPSDAEPHWVRCHLYAPTISAPTALTTDLAEPKTDETP